ncbi:hypothetical protein CQA49_09020 [Helicobacter sp. MIT 00-7814]|uniref:hypothetical protein n=1 Tax=unclassified Helicobacter TaxID=2593540 RepID=UPI000E1F089B|nr:MULTISPECIES: hypothetical protein [unclassified Helicobacter]RDU51892.1 hypothetical protein CQA49_09020 [Helicobacter sp. MIT 00-7814]RDU54055.1 hypothetical protein CQA37_06350 [Helicobacter sp. MIT 99-10781]
MSVKSDLSQFKSALDTDGQILESAFRFEIFARRHRKKLIALGVIVALGIVCGVAYSFISESKMQKANVAYEALLALPNELDARASAKELLETLKQNNKALYEFYLFTHIKNDGAVLRELADSKNEFIATMSRYDLGQMELANALALESKGAQDLKNEASKNEDSNASAESANKDISAIFASLESLKNKDLKEWLLLQEAALLLEQGRVQEAKSKAAFIDTQSSLSTLANIIKHYK